jgi:beta-glucosidase
MAEETIVLLQNKGNILPLQAGAKVALVGPNANDREMMWGNYNPIPEQTITLLDGLKAHVPDLVAVKGCGIVGEKEDIKTVLKQLEGKDIVIFAGGISPNYEGEEMDVDAPGFRGGDRTSIELPAVQRELLKALHDAGKKVVLVNFSGSAMGLVPETETCDAIVEAWYPGEEGGAVLADVLYGQVVPSGKLPVTFYKNVDQLPDFEDYNMKGRTYRYFEGEPLYPFGYGLSYTTFAYGEAKIDGNKIVISINNNGSFAGTEVVQLYVRKADDAEGPIKSLRGFQRVTIPAGQSAEVVFPLTEETFLSWNEEKQNMVPAKGKWELLYGGNSHDVKKIDYDFK